MKTVYYQLDVSCTINKAQMKTIHPGYIRNTVTCMLKFVPLFCIIWGGGGQKKTNKQSSPVTHHVALEGTGGIAPTYS
jgi:hypothetical protein